ncbi:hypothetical protein [Pelagibaculum spongiae]|uniref:DUF3592 domain-containing protein n=1 Tax=Pelagibaculum spongiae TaxID=2080658 RepID=A0A2V1H1S2_9GAMM|nr:hypothetical protein [Pelagibaculum spongiae]PVZ71900.1 hypothetical protein DC094_02440 [Pelagibaculum spongiae]
MNIIIIFMGLAICLYAIIWYVWSLFWVDIQAKVMQVEYVNKSVPGSVLFRLKYKAVLYKFMLNKEKKLGGQQGLFLKGFGPNVLVGDTVIVIKNPSSNFFCLKRRFFDFCVMLALIAVGAGAMFAFW